MVEVTQEQFEALFNVLVPFTLAKNKTYGDNWQKRGELLSVMGNILRKTDRFEKMAMDMADGLEIDVDDKIDTVADLAVYCLLYLMWLRSKQSVGWNAFVDKVRNYVVTHSKDIFELFKDKLS